MIRDGQTESMLQPQCTTLVIHQARPKCFTSYFSFIVLNPESALQRMLTVHPLTSSSTSQANLTLIITTLLTLLHTWSAQSPQSKDIRHSEQIGLQIAWGAPCVCSANEHRGARVQTFFLGKTLAASIPKSLSSLLPFSLLLIAPLLLFHPLPLSFLPLFFTSSPPCFLPLSPSPSLSLIHLPSTVLTLFVGCFAYLSIVHIDL